LREFSGILPRYLGIFVRIYKDFAQNFKNFPRFSI